MMEQPLGKQTFNHLVPELQENPMIECDYAKKMTLSEGIGSSSELRQVYEAIISL